MLVRRCLCTDVSELWRDGRIPHVHALLILSILVHRRRLREQRLGAVCSPAVDINAMPLLWRYISLCGVRQIWAGRHLNHILPLENIWNAPPFVLEITVLLPVGSPL